MLMSPATILQPQSDWAPIVILIMIAIAFAIGTVMMSSLIGPSRTGKVKEMIYESGMSPVRDTRRRFNARFYLVAMIFVVFDVAIVFYYPWATVFAHAGGELKALLLWQMLIFSAIILSAYIYAWGKGAFSWD